MNGEPNKYSHKYSSMALSDVQPYSEWESESLECFQVKHMQKNKVKHHFHNFCNVFTLVQCPVKEWLFQHVVVRKLLIALPMEQLLAAFLRSAHPLYFMLDTGSSAIRSIKFEVDQMNGYGEMRRTVIHTQTGRRNL